MATTRIKIIPIEPKGAKVNTAAVQQDITSMMRRATAEGRRKMARYPAQRLRKSGYRRTGTLKRSWSFKVAGSFGKVEGTVGSNSNIAPYNRFVQGPTSGEGQHQLALFRGAGWQGVDGLEDFMEDRVERGLQQIIDRLAR